MTRLRRFFGLALLCCTPVLLQATQEDQMYVPPEGGRYHWIEPLGVIRADIPHGPGSRREVIVQIVVGTGGNVESAHAIEGPKQLFAEAEAIELARRFKPFVQGGQAVRATFKDFVEILPPERWGTKTPFPAVKDWNSLRFTLERPSGYCMSCPAYHVEIRGDGTVIFQGEQSSLISGTHRGTISKEDLAALLKKFREGDYFSLKNRYVTGATDGMVIITSVTVDTQTKTVTDDGGIEVGMPDVVESLERAVDKAAGIDKWTIGNAATWPALQAEHWDFKAKTDENRQLFQGVIAHGSSELIQNFLAAGAPALEFDKSGAGPLEAAAKKGDLALVQRMIAGSAPIPSPLLARSLKAAAASGNVQVLELLLERGADVNATTGDDYEVSITVLMNAVDSGNVAMVQSVLEHHPLIDARDWEGETALMRAMSQHKHDSEVATIVPVLLGAGANVNARANDGRTAIFFACHSVEAVRIVARAGADMNAQDIGGQTAVMHCANLEGQQAMIDAGADLTIRNGYGQTAAEWFRSEGLIDQASFLDAAMKANKK